MINGKTQPWTLLLCSSAALGMIVCGTNSSSAQLNPKTRADSKVEVDVDASQSGTLSKIQKGRIQVKFEDGTRRFFTLSPDTKLLLNEKPVKVDALKVGDEIDVVISAGATATTIEATRLPADPTIQATNPESVQRQQAEERRNAEIRREIEAEDEGFKSNRVFLGVVVLPHEQQGVFVAEVATNGPAERAGLEAGDVILSINGIDLDTTDDFQKVLSKLEPGANGKFVVRRDGEQQQITTEFVSHEKAGFRPNDSGEYGQVLINEPEACLGVMMTKGGDGEVVITRVHPECPAREAGLQAGDVLLSIGDNQVSDVESASEILEKMKPDSEVSLVVRRDGIAKTIETSLVHRHQLVSTESGAAAMGHAPGMNDQHQLMVEQHYEFSRQHERMEQLTRQLLEEVKELRKEVQQLKAAQ